ncbi:MAG: hypothetical protein M1837_001777 [Sclerophora amabilis]|nr:MAG: hypothetical protein M1837_001777 [Sclerophora amabilis]
MDAILPQMPQPKLGRFLCATCAASFRRSRQVSSTARRIGLQNSRRIGARSFQSSAPLLRQTQSPTPPSQDQAAPLDGYYQALLEQPLPTAASRTEQPTSEPPPASTDSTSEKDERIAKARIVFGSRLAGPAERRSELDSKSTMVAGVRVPPRPSEPDNCCMSGCVNCVWDRFGDELEEWAAKSGEARARLAQAREKGRREGTGLMAVEDGTPRHVATSMDDDGGGSESNWGFGQSDGIGGDLLGSVPVGIREFMRTEKRLKEKHLRKGSLGG